ncbi:hypothetical protein GCM10009430_31890 [Aquimarina litoralis]|uniref:Uncharacterized protein n=1 Tax=Aquimarina litoralis TaxID=584605 RepID=A0ABP3U705_9FLAO
MAIKSFHYIPADFPNGKEPVIKKIIQMIFENVDNYEEFQLHLLRDKIGLDDNEKRQFNELLSILRNELIKSDRIEIVRGTLFRMLPEKPNNDQPTVQIENFISGNNLGIQSNKGNVSDSMNQNPRSNKYPLLQYLFWLAVIIGTVITIYNTFFNNK